MKDLKEKFRQHMRLVWELSALDEESLGDDDQALVEIMQMHPQYYELWNRLDEVTGAELAQMETNPVLHVLMHQIVENQLAGQAPLESAETLDQLVRQGFTRHEAIHQIGQVLTDDMQDMVESNRSFDEQRYAQTLRQLVRPRRRHRRRR